MLLTPAVHAAVSQDTVSLIIKKGELHVGIMSDDRWPFFYVGPKGDLQGIDVEIAKRFAESLGVKARITRETSGFKTTLEAVELNKMDVAFSAFYPTVQRAMKVKFSEPYCKLKGVFVTKRAGRKMASTQRKLIGTYDSTLFESSLRNRFPESKVIIFNKRKEIWDALKSEKIESLYTDDLEVAKEKNENKNFNLYFKVESDHGSSYPIAAAFSFKSRELSELLNLWIKNEEAMGNLQRHCFVGAKK